jgi:RNA polymerase sigma factor for flagellar operon FliA
METSDRNRAELRDELISEHGHFPRVIALKFAATPTRAAFLDDLIAAGNVGLCEAAHRFDPSCGVKFSTFAWPRIRGAMVDGLRTSARYRRSDVALHRAAPSDAVTCRPAPRTSEDEPSEDPRPEAEEAIDVGRNLPRVAAALDLLPPREREVLQLHYFEGLMLSEIAARMGVHRSWCTRLHQRALQLLQRQLAPGAGDVS